MSLRLLPLAFGLLIPVKASALSSLNTLVLATVWVFSLSSSESEKKCFQTNAELRTAVEEYTEGDRASFLEVYGEPKDWCIKELKDLSYVFSNIDYFDGNIGSWDVSHVQDVSGMFMRSHLSPNIGGWNMSNVLYVPYMFYEASHFNQDLSRWDLRNAQNMDRMFMWALSFNQDLCPWGSRIPRGAKVTRLFHGSNCIKKGDPDLHANPPGPFCHVCTTSPPTAFTQGPTRNPTISLSPTQRPPLAPSLSVKGVPTLSKELTLSPSNRVLATDHLMGGSPSSLSGHTIPMALATMAFSFCVVASCIAIALFECQKWEKKNEELHQRTKELADLISEESSKDLPPPTVVAVAAQDPRSVAEAGPKEFPEEGGVELVPSGYEESVWFG